MIKTISLDLLSILTIDGDVDALIDAGPVAVGSRARVYALTPFGRCRDE